MPDPILDENGNPVNPDPNTTEGGETKAPEGGGAGFTKLQMEQLATLTGRILKNQLDESVIPLFNREPAASQRDETPPATMKAFNEKLQEKIFAGDVMDALDKADEVRALARENLANARIKEADRAIISYSEKPYYKDIHAEMDKIAKQAIRQGVPPQWAADHAYHKALSEHLSSSGREENEDGGRLSMLEGGRQQRKQTGQKLPERFKEAAKRDIAKGVFKDEKDYIANLSPQIREQYGI